MWPFSFLSYVGGIRGALSILATLAICWTLHGWRMAWVESSHQNELEVLALKLRAECEASAKKLEGLNNDYVNRLKSINSRHADAISRLLRHEQAKAHAPGMDDGAARGDAVHRAVGILDFGRAAEENTAKLIGCQAYVRGLE